VGVYIISKKITGKLVHFYMQEKLYQIRTGTGGICYKRITAANVTVIPAYDRNANSTYKNCELF